jgi:hypothetical protein
MTEKPIQPAVLNAKNYDRGMLIDDEWMAGISKDSEGFSMFVVDHAGGEVLFHSLFPALDDALAAVNQIPRGWRYEATGGCSGERCGEGKCKGEGCKIYSGPRKGSCD